MIEKVLIYNQKLSKEIILKDYVEKQSDYLKKKYLDLVYDLSNFKIKNKILKNHYNIFKNHNLWEMSLIQEKNTLKSKSIFSIIKFFACYELINQNKKKKITFFLHDKLLINSLKDYSNKNKLSLNFEIISDSPQQLFSFLNSFLSIIKFTIKNFFLKRKNFKNLDSETLIMSYFAHYKFNKNEFKFLNWKGIENVIDKKKISWLQIFIPNQKIKTIQNINKYSNLSKTNNLQFIENYLNLKIKFKAFLIYMKFFFKFFFEIKNFEDKTKNELLYYLIKIQKKDILDSLIGFHLYQNLIWILVFESIFSNIKKKKFGLYIFENQNWEKAFVNAWKNNNHGKIIAYVPASINYWKLNFFHSKRELNSSNKFFKPDLILTNCRQSTQQMKKFNLYKTQIKEVEALRYNYLENIILGKKQLKNNSKVLYIGDYLDYENHNFLKFFFSNTKIKLPKLYIKPHPASLFFFKGNIKNKYKYKVINYSFNKIINQFDKIISSNSTSAGLEYLIMKKSIMVFNNTNYLDLSPFKKSKVPYLKNIKQIINFKKNNFLFRKYKDFYITDNSLKKWKKIINEINKSEYS